MRFKKHSRFLLGFGFVFAQSQALCGHAPSLSLAKTPKLLAAAWLRFFFKRSRSRRLYHGENAAASQIGSAPALIVVSIAISGWLKVQRCGKMSQ
jgi:hypothetical protein